MCVRIYTIHTSISLLSYLDFGGDIGELGGWTRVANQLCVPVRSKSGLMVDFFLLEFSKYSQNEFTCIWI